MEYIEFNGNLGFTIDKKDYDMIDIYMLEMKLNIIHQK